MARSSFQPFLSSKWITLVILWFLAFSPLYVVAYATPKATYYPVLVLPITPTFTDVIPQCQYQCWDTWELEGY